MPHPPEPPLSLADGLRLSRLTLQQLWLRCQALGATGDSTQLRAHLESETCPDAHEHNVIAQALNDWYSENGRDYSVEYEHLYVPPPTD